MEGNTENGFTGSGASLTSRTAFRARNSLPFVAMFCRRRWFTVAHLPLQSWEDRPQWSFLKDNRRCSVTFLIAGTWSFPIKPGRRPLLVFSATSDGGALAYLREIKSEYPGEIIEIGM